MTLEYDHSDSFEIEQYCYDRSERDSQYVAEAKEKERGKNSISEYCIDYPNDNKSDKSIRPQLI